MASVLNREGTTARYQAPKRKLRTTEAARIPPRGRRTSERSASSNLRKRTKIMTNRAPRANENASRKKVCGRKLGLKKAEAKVLSQGQPSEVSMNPMMPVIRNAEAAP